jgi:integrase
MSQSLIKIENKDHYYYDEKSKVIYFIRKTQNEYMKFSTRVKYDGSASCLIKAARVVSVREKEKKEIKVKSKNPINNILIGEHLDLMKERAIQDGLSKATLTSYDVSFKHLKEYFEGYAVDEVTSEEWLKFLGNFRERNPGLRLFNITKHFKKLINYLHENGLILKKPKIHNPYNNKERVDRKKKRHRIYTPGEILQMDAVCTEDQRLALWLGYEMGFRLDDCVKLRWDRINFHEKTITFFGDENKTNFVGRVPVSDTCLLLLKDRKKHSESDFVFHQATDKDKPIKTQQLAFEEVVRSSGVGYGSFHLLRHTRLTEDFGNKNLDNALVIKIRRVSLKVALEHYIHPTDSDLESFRNTGLAKRVSK